MKRVAMKSKFTIILLATILFWSGCRQSEPEFNARTGDILTFAGRQWWIKHAPFIMGPGGNFFSNHPNDVWVDNNGHLHLTVTEREGTWRCTEVVSLENMGYGTYIWTIRGNPVDIDPTIVLGLFTWDDSTFAMEANSEVDIEFSKWLDPKQEYTLQYGVQPINFGPYFPERDHKPEVDPKTWIGVSTHAFTWTDTLITWASWPGNKYGNGDPVARWSFDLTNEPRVKNEGGQSSRPIVIPAPGNQTNARMNLWLIRGLEGPTVPRRHEMVIENFEYYPL
jgi:hypothetical protein